MWVELVALQALRRTFASVVISTPGEEHQIRGLLEKLFDTSTLTKFAIGIECTNWTLDTAGKFEHLTVVEIENVDERSTLNEGDEFDSGQRVLSLVALLRRTCQRREHDLPRNGVDALNTRDDRVVVVTRSFRGWRLRTETIH